MRPDTPPPSASTAPAGPPADPRAAPRIDPNFLSHDDDLETLFALPLIEPVPGEAAAPRPG